MAAVLTRCFLLVVLLFSQAASAAVIVEWVDVGGAPNSCDPQSQGCFGSVPYEYQIGEYEVTNAQYVEFLNAVAATDTNSLYNSTMASVPQHGGIARTGSSGSFAYSSIAGRGDMPVNHVSFWDAARFANWLHNGQPAGLQDATTTEDGAYTLTPAGVTANSVTRNTGATVFLPSEAEWYKSAYYDSGATSYLSYPAGSDAQTTCALPGPTANTANCITAMLAIAGSYTGASSPNGTFDQGGNVWEWSDTIPQSASRGIRGGGLFSNAIALAALSRGSFNALNAQSNIGFRVASVSTGWIPPPAVPSVSPFGIAIVLSLMGALGLRRL